MYDKPFTRWIVTFQGGPYDGSYDTDDESPLANAARIMAIACEMQGLGTYRSNIFYPKTPVRYFYKAIHADETSVPHSLILEYDGYVDLDGRHPSPEVPN